MQRIKFEPFPDVSVEKTSNPLTILLKGPDTALNKIAKKLTVRNKSIAFQIDRIHKQIARVNGWGDPRNQIPKLFKEIEELQKEEIQELFTRTSEGLEVPAGFWWFGGKNDGSHLNTNLKEFYLPGLRHYQEEALKELFKYKRASICLATGLGKSLIISSICIAAEKSGLRTCVIVPTDYLVKQMLETIGKSSESLSAQGGKRNFKLGSNICVTTAQSAMKVIDNFDVIAMDEAHHSPASTWLNILTNCNASHVYSLTATPFRADGLDLNIHAFTGPLVYERDARWGIANGWLKPVKVYLKTIPYAGHLKKDMNSQMAYKILSSNPTVLAEIKNNLIKAKTSGRRAIVLFKTVKACEALKKYCAPEIVFDVASSKFKKPIDDFRDGICNVLVSNDRLISEGLDVPNADLLILCTQNSSKVITSQAVGRVLRKTEGFAIVIDITFGGYLMFERCRSSRETVYAQVTDEIFDIDS